MREAQEYVLLNKDVPVASFLYDAESHTIVKVTRRHSLEHAPLGALDSSGSLTAGTLAKWWHGRSIPASRRQIESLVERLRIDTPMVLVEKSLGLSLSDRYWVCPKGSGLAWRDVNFFDNAFTEDLGLMTAGEPSAGDPDFVSPSATLGGVLQKKWTIAGGKRILMKGGSGFVAQEVYNEVAATRLHERLLDPGEFVPYELRKSSGTMYCACENMLREDEELVPAAHLLARYKKPNHLSDSEHLLAVYERIGIRGPRRVLSKMLLCDCLLANRDRHYNNFGVIRNVETLEFVRPAPIFDSGTSLWCWSPSLDSDEDFDYQPMPFGRKGVGPFEQAVVYEDASWAAAERLRGFGDELAEALSANPNMPQARIERIVQAVDRRAARLFGGEREARAESEPAPRALLARAGAGRPVAGGDGEAVVPGR